MTSTLEKQSKVSPKKPERIFGRIINLLYSGSSEYLQAIVVEDEKDSEKIFRLGVDLNENVDTETIEIENLNNFETKFQKAFDREAYINIEYVDNQISSIVLVACLPVSDNQKNLGSVT
ncbi:MAG: hypothetical protein ACRC80_20510, partial [Waterburya sp.]